MSAVPTTLPSVAIQRSLRHTLTIYAKETKYDFLGRLRLPVYSISTVMFPVMFYVLFGLLLNRGHEVGGVNVAAYASRYNDRVSVVPSTVSLREYQPRPLPPLLKAKPQVSDSLVGTSSPA